MGSTISALAKWVFFKSLQYFWSFLTALNLLKDRILLGSAFSAIKDHPEPECLKGWDSRYIQLDSVRLHYVQTGSDDAPLMLFIHGFPEFWYSWRYQLRHFKDKYRCVAIDQRGYNLSDKPVGKENYHGDLLVKDIQQVVTKLGYKKAVVVGHDWGAIVAWRTAMMFPEIVDKLIILNVPHPLAFGAGGLGQLLKSWYIFMFQTPWLPELSVSSGDFRMLSLMFRGKKGGIKNKKNFTDDDLEAWKHVFSQKGALTPPINYYRMIGAMKPLKGDQAIVKPETLIVWGSGDPFLAREGAVKSIDFCRSARLHFIEGASHWIMQDEPEKVNQHMEEFLEEKEKGGNETTNNAKL